MPTRSLRFASAICAAVLLSSGPVVADEVKQHPRVRQAIALLEIWLEAQRDFDQIPGLSAAVVHDQQVVWTGAYGFADVAKKTPARPDTVYSVCSISKLFTSIAVMQQRDSGKLRLDDPVSKHLPWFAIKRTDPDMPEITVEGLLTHSAGLPREAEFPYWTGPEFAFPTRQQIIDKLKTQETLHPAHTYFQYSNLGLTLAGEIAAAAAGKGYEEYVRTRVLDPLGMTNTTPDMPRDKRGGKLAAGYSAIGRDGRRQEVSLFAAQGIAPAAGFASTVEDLAKFASWQFRLLDRKGDSTVLTPNTLREMHRVHFIDPDFQTTWGLGFGVWRDKDKTFVGHGGSCPGFRAQLLMKTDEKVSVVLMANAQGVNTTQLAQRAYEIVAPAVKAAAKPDTSKPAAAPTKPDPSLDKYTGTYATGFAGEVAIVPWEDGLAVVGLPTMDPMGALAKLKKSGEHTFRRLRKDETLAEPLVFEMGPDGRAARIAWHSNAYRRVK